MFVLLSAFAAAAQVAAAPSGATDSDPIVCTKVNVGDEVGTRLRAKKKVCMHKSDKDYIDRQKKDELQHLLNDGDPGGLAPTGPPR